MAIPQINTLRPNNSPGRVDKRDSQNGSGSDSRLLCGEQPWGRRDLSDAEWDLIGPLLPSEWGAIAQAFGRSRGGFTSNVHARCDNQGLPVGFILTGGEASDYTAADDLMALPLPKPKAPLADKGYDGDRFRENLLMRGILPIIPPRSSRKVPIHPDYRRYKDRNRVERMFHKLK